MEVQAGNEFDQTTPVPIVGQEVASASKEDRRSVRRLSEYVWQQFQSGLAARKAHAVSWIMVKSFMRGIHHFEIDAAGSWRPIPHVPGKIRAVVPILRPMFNHVMGLVTANELGFVTTPVAGADKPIYQANRARDILMHWRDETNFRSTFDRSMQYLLTEGMVAFHRFLDPFRQQAFVRLLPGSELFPIPHNAKSPLEVHGIIHASIVTESWLEIQDEMLERMAKQAGVRAPRERMAEKTTGFSGMMHVNLPLGNTLGGGGFKGALALTVWLRKNEITPLGEYLFMVGDRAYRHILGPGLEHVMPDGEIPMEFASYSEDPDDFWGGSLCETQIPAQLSIDRQMTAAEVNARRNRSLLFVDVDRVDVKDIQREDAAAIPVKSAGYDLETRKGKPVDFFPPTNLGRDSYALVELAGKFADQAAGFRSGIPFGVQEGRTESGPATGMLAQHAMATLNTVLRRVNHALDRTYPHILDMVREVWPPEKFIKVASAGDIGREIRVQRDTIPWSKDVIIKSAPLLAGGRQTQANILFHLREIPGEDGKIGTEITSAEFRAGLMELNLLPPGINLANRPDARIKTRISLLINDGETPAIQPADPKNPRDRMVLEDHRLAVRMLTDVILDESWHVYSKTVQSALRQELEFHHSLTFGAATHPQEFDDDLDKLAAMQLENFLSFAEADPSTEEGDFMATLGVR